MLTIRVQGSITSKTSEEIKLISSQSSTEKYKKKKEENINIKI